MSFPVSGSIGGLIFTVLGSIGVASALYFFVRQRMRLRSTVCAEGVVVESVVERREGTTDSGASTIDVWYFPKVRFSPASGGEITFTSGTGSGRPAYQTGARLPVRYDPNRTEDAEIDGFWENWLPSVAFGGMGLFFMVVGLATMAGSAAR